MIEEFLELYKNVSQKINAQNRVAKYTSILKHHVLMNTFSP